MIRAILLGSGNLAVHLSRALGAAKDISLVQRFARGDNNSELFDPGIPKTGNIKDLLDADIYLIAIKDDEIAQFSEKLSAYSGLVVHTSGSIGMMELCNGPRKGVCYPVQTFSAGRALDFGKIPLAIEAAEEKDLLLLKEFAAKISNRVYEISSEQRKMLHLAAVYANNFSNHMFTQADKICAQNNIPFDMLGPLMEETVNKLGVMSPREAQTGPARRKDREVISRQMALLEPEMQNLYKTLSESIMGQYNTN